MATILLCGVDLFMRGKLEALLPEHRFQTSDGIDPPALVIADIARKGGKTLDSVLTGSAARAFGAGDLGVYVNAASLTALALP